MKISSKNSKRMNIMMGVTCIVLSIILVAAITSFAKALENKGTRIADLKTQVEQQQSEIDTLKQQISNLQKTDTANLTRQIAEKDMQIANLTNRNAALIDEVNSLQAQLSQILSTQEKIRDSIMDYIKFNHPETAQFMNILSWTGGRTTPPTLIGAETYIYTSDGWKFTINYPVVPTPLYNITADYSAPFTGIPYRIIWKGSWQNWYITETSYVFAQ